VSSVLPDTLSQGQDVLLALQIFSTALNVLMELSVSSVLMDITLIQRVPKSVLSVLKTGALNATPQLSAPSVPETITFSILRQTPANYALKLCLTASDASTPPTAVTVKSVSTRTLPKNALSVLETVSLASLTPTAPSAKSVTFHLEVHATDALMPPAFPATKPESVTTAKKALS
jgi:hypothetical protein